MTYDEYSALSAINFSTLKAMALSPLHYHHGLTTPKKDRDSFRLGRASHTAVFEPDRFALEYAVYRGARRAGNDWEQFKEAHECQTILTVAQYERALAIRDAVRAHPGATRYLAKGRAEQTIEWTDRETGRRCKGRLDWCADELFVLGDLKTAVTIDERLFAMAVARLGYHTQLAFYSDGLRETTGKDWKAVIIAAENMAPHDVGVFHLDVDVLHRGREEYRRLLAMVAGCRALGQWRGRYTEEQSLVLPAWASDHEEETDAPEFDNVETSTGAGL